MRRLQGAMGQHGHRIVLDVSLLVQYAPITNTAISNTWPHQVKLAYTERSTQCFIPLRRANLALLCSLCATVPQSAYVAPKHGCCIGTSVDRCHCGVLPTQLPLGGHSCLLPDTVRSCGCTLVAATTTGQRGAAARPPPAAGARLVLCLATDKKALPVVAAWRRAAAGTYPS